MLTERIHRIYTHVPGSADIMTDKTGVEYFVEDGDKFFRTERGQWINAAYLEDWGAGLRHTPGAPYLEGAI